jgi:uncharacterized protein
VEIAIISDTHMPRGGRSLPSSCVARLERADMIIHAGDLVELGVLRELERYAPVIAVRGNVDDTEVRAVLPETANVNAEDSRLAVIHDAGPARGRLARLRVQFAGADAVIFGHSHIPLHETAPDGFQIFNPGSPTERRRAPHRTMGTATAAHGRLKLRIHSLD